MGEEEEDNHSLEWISFSFKQKFNDLLTIYGYILD